jgi:phosphoribosyl-dephospho-CoA transferase
VTPRDAASPALVRHGWVWLNDGWASVLRPPLTPDDHALLSDWRLRGRPLVVARAQPGDPADTVRLGLATPDKRRIAVHIGMEAVAFQAPPPPLSAATATAPEAWRPTLEKVAAITAAAGVGAAVFGSLAWEHLTGLSYVRPDSDVDLLFTARRLSQVETVLAGLTDLDRAGAPPRLDGEILLPGTGDSAGGAVAWRELAARPAKLLVKGVNAVSLCDLAVVIGQFQDDQFQMQEVG